MVGQQPGQPFQSFTTGDKETDRELGKRYRGASRLLSVMGELEDHLSANKDARGFIDWDRMNDAAMTRTKQLQANLRLETTRAFELGAISEGDKAIVDDMAGGDLSKWTDRDPAALLAQQQATLYNTTQAEFEGAGFRGRLPMPRSLEEGETRRAEQATAADRDVNTAKVRDETGMTPEQFEAEWQTRREQRAAMVGMTPEELDAKWDSASTQQQRQAVRDGAVVPLTQRDKDQFYEAASIRREQGIAHERRRQQRIREGRGVPGVDFEAQ